PRGRARVVAGVVSGVVVLAAAVVAVVLALDAPPTVAPTEQPTVTADPTDAPVVAVPAPVDLEGERVSPTEVRFTWTNPEPQEGDTYLWGEVVTGQPTELTQVDEPTVVVP